MGSTTRRQIIIGGASGLVGLAATGVASTAQNEVGEPAPATGSQRAIEGRFNGKVVLITGATSGIGRATAFAFAREGARVVFCGRRVALGQQVESEIKQAGAEALYVRADVLKPADVEAFVTAALEAYGGRIDVAFNNAGVEGSGAYIHEETEANWDKVIGTNLKGIWLSMKYEIPHMLKQRSGVIINTASTLGFAGLEGVADYSASKHGILGLTKSAALECRTSGVRINAVAPGPIRTPLWERANKTTEDKKMAANKVAVLKRIGNPDEIAKAVLWLASDEASFVAGQSLTVDGGMLIDE